MSLTTHHHRLRLHKKHPPQTQIREIEVLIISAENLKTVKHVTKINPFAVVYVDKLHVAKTHVHHNGQTNPTWNETVKVKFPQHLPETDVMAALNVDIYADGHLKKPMGSTRILLCDVLKGEKPDVAVDNPIQCMTVQLWRDSGEPHGLLNLWVPPTGRFLIRRESSLPISAKDMIDEEVAAAAARAGEREVNRGDDGGAGGSAASVKLVELFRTQLV